MRSFRYVWSVLFCLCSLSNMDCTKERIGTPVTPAIIPTDLKNVFPPHWKVGDHWRVKTTALADVSRFKREWEVQEYIHVYEVLEVPNVESKSFRLRVTSEGRPHIFFELLFRTRPFSLERATSYDTKTGQRNLSLFDSTEGYPVVGSIRDELAYDFPCYPGFSGRQTESFGDQESTVTQTLSRLPDGIRFVVATVGKSVTMDWKRGDPWWSTLERTDLAGFLPFLGKAELLRP